MRGWLARNRKFKHKVYEHVAAVQIIDRMVTNYLEDRMIPDLLKDILVKNHVFDDVDLYSTDVRATLICRNEMMDRVMKKMIRE